MSSDSGSAQNFREMEDGYAFDECFMVDATMLMRLRSFAAYAASKAALNQMLRVGTVSSNTSILSLFTRTVVSKRSWNGATPRLDNIVWGPFVTWRYREKNASADGPFSTWRQS
jgi:hypothetical protein